MRVAVAYSGLKQPEAAKKLNVSKETLSRMENGRGTITVTNEQVAEAFDVPIEFLQAGWEPLRRPIGDVERRLYEVEARLSAIEAKRPGGDSPQAPRGALAREIADETTSIRTPERKPRRKAAGARKDSAR